MSMRVLSTLSCGRDGTKSKRCDEHESMRKENARKIDHSVDSLSDFVDDSGEECSFSGEEEAPDAESILLDGGAAEYAGKLASLSLLLKPSSISLAR